MTAWNSVMHFKHLGIQEKSLTKIWQRKSQSGDKMQKALGEEWEVLFYLEVQPFDGANLLICCTNQVIRYEI